MVALVLGQVQEAHAVPLVEFEQASVVPKVDAVLYMVCEERESWQELHDVIFSTQLTDAQVKTNDVINIHAG